MALDDYISGFWETVLRVDHSSFVHQFNLMFHENKVIIFLFDKDNF